MAGATVLDNRALNRATLERQLLLRRHDMTVREAVTHLVGMQSQLPNPPYTGLWSRLERFELDDLTELMNRREIVRGSLLRGTLHVATAEDYIALRPLLQPLFVKAARTFRKATDLLDIDEMLAYATEILADQRHTGADLKRALGERWPECDASLLLYATQCLLPLVYVPPGGTWGKGGSSVLATAESWFGRTLPEMTDPRDTILRYLAAFGPSSTMDVQFWSGLTHLKPVMEDLRPRLRTFRSAETGVELFDVPDAPLPDPDTEAPVRLIPEYDNLLMAHADRTRVISDERRAITHTRNGMIAATVLLDGVVAGKWRVARGKQSAVAVEVEQFRRFTPEERELVEAEAAAFLAMAYKDADTRDVVFKSF